jgi:5'-3' exonuclease
MKYILVDTANMFFRARHVVRGDSIETKIGMAYHIMFASILKAYRDFNGSHVVFCLEGRSWRKDFYEPYKANRKVARDALTPKEAEEDKAYWEAFDELNQFLNKRTNCTVLQNKQCEADDFIARWIQNHPDDEHVMISSDSDFYQLLSEKVTQYNGISNQHIKIDGIVNDKGKPVIDKKTKEQKQIGDPEYLLFEKCVRGDTSDNIFSAYPGVRKKGTKNKIGIQEAFADKESKGFNWNNFMLQRWTDHEGVEHRVLEDYQRNRELIDLTAQPQPIKDALDEVITTQVNKTPTGQVGIKFMKFCGKYDLQKISEHPTDHATYLNAGYA